MAFVLPLVDLQAQRHRIRGELDEALGRVMDSGRYVGGRECEAFEAEFAAFCGVRAAVGVASGTDALTLILRALGVGPGDEVVTVGATFVATAEAILANGARPVFVDVDPRTFTMDPAALGAALSARTRAVVPVHLYGHPADMGPLLEVAGSRGIPVVEDAAQAHGAAIGGRRAGSFGRAAAFSFFPGKNLGAMGDGGMVVTDDGELAARVRQLANHGAGQDKYDNVVAGTNSRLDALQAAVLRVKLRHLEGWNAERRQAAAGYVAALRDLPGLELPGEREGCASAWHLFTVRTPGRDALRAHLGRRGIAAQVHYPRPVHLQPALGASRLEPGSLPVTERLSSEVLSLPLFPEMGADAVRTVSGAVREWVAG